MQHYGSPAARALYCSVDAEAYARAMSRRWDLSYLGTYSPDRQPMLERLLLEPARRAPQLRFVVAGPQYPRTSTGQPMWSGWSMCLRPTTPPSTVPAATR
jgi:spore maturation protein CgeB